MTRTDENGTIQKQTSRKNVGVTMARKVLPPSQHLATREDAKTAAHLSLWPPNLSISGVSRSLVTKRYPAKTISCCASSKSKRINSVDMIPCIDLPCLAASFLQMESSHVFVASYICLCIGNTDSAYTLRHSHLICFFVFWILWANSETQKYRQTGRRGS